MEKQSSGKQSDSLESFIHLGARSASTSLPLPSMHLSTYLGLVTSGRIGHTSVKAGGKVRGKLLKVAEGYPKAPGSLSNPSYLAIYPSS